METGKVKIPFYAKRTFSEKMTVTFDFVKENWKILLKYITVFILPVCILQGLSLNAIMTVAGDPEFMQELVSSGSYGELFSYLTQLSFYLIFTFLGTALVTGLLYALMQLYNEREEGLKGVALRDFKSLLLRNVGRYFIQVLVFMLLLFVFIIVLTLLAVITVHTLWITVPLFFVLLVAWGLWVPVYLFEREGVFKALVRGTSLGFATWGGVLGMAFVTGIIASVLAGVLSMPWTVMYFIQQLFQHSDMAGIETASTGYRFTMYLLAVLRLFGTYLSMIFVQVALAYQYAHASEKVGGISVESDVENFEKF